MCFFFHSDDAITSSLSLIVSLSHCIIFLYSHSRPLLRSRFGLIASVSRLSTTKPRTTSLNN